MAETEQNESEQTPQGDAGGGEQGGAAQAAAAESGAGGSPRRRSRARKSEKPAAQPLSPEERQARRVAQRAGNAVHRRRRRRQEREKALAARSAGAAATPELPAVHAPKRGAPKERQGIVVSSKADKTITVRIDVARQHRRYEKTVRSSTTLHAHDEQNSANEGDVVRVVESRPSSKTKRWQLLDVMERAR